MDERIIDIAQHPACLAVRHQQLVISSNGTERTVPVNEIAALVVSNPAVTYTQAVLSGLCESGGALVVCDARHLPIGLLMPLAGNSTQAERFEAQARAPAPLKKRLWQQIVKAKVLSQAACLTDVRGEDYGLRRLAQQVKSGDTTNVEAQASRRYWPALFGPGFQRDRNLDDQNSLLNYGYAVLRAMTARAICGSGLHPSLGIHHHNRYDTFCLASDLMEPYRPVVDRAVVETAARDTSRRTLTPAVKASLVGALMARRYAVKGEDRTIPDLVAQLAASLAQVFLGNRKKLTLPVV